MKAQMLGTVICLLAIAAPSSIHSLADGRMEEGRKGFFEVAQRSYVDVVKYLDDKNQNAAKTAAAKLKDELTRYVENPVLYIERDIESIDRDLKSKWAEVVQAFGNLRTSVGLLEAKIGNGDASSELSTMKDRFSKFGDKLNEAYSQFVRFGKEFNEKARKFQVLCDSCR